VLGWPDGSQAQGLVWSLPEDTSFVRFEGDYKETLFRPQNVQGDLSLQWRAHLIIRSVGKEEADFNGRSVPCRWLEFESVTGREVAGKIQPGPGGLILVKALVPEEKINGKSRDENDIAIEYLPIIKGFMKIDDKPVEELETKILQLYPLLTQLRNYSDLKSQGQESLEIAGQNVDCQKLLGSVATENNTSRSTNTATIWETKGVPFGLAKYSVKIEREQKDPLADRTEYRPAAEITIVMQAIEHGSGDQSKLATP
jgi:hypothetical protein